MLADVFVALAFLVGFVAFDMLLYRLRAMWAWGPQFKRQKHREWTK